VKLHMHLNEWFSRQARLELAARAETGGDVSTVKKQLHELLRNKLTSS